MNQCQHGNDPEDCPSCNRQPTDAPTPERLTDPTPEARTKFLSGLLSAFYHSRGPTEFMAVAETLADTFAKAAVERERERCVKIANNNVFLAAQAEPKSTATNWCARITAAIVSGETP